MPPPDPMFLTWVSGWNIERFKIRPIKCLSHYNYPHTAENMTDLFIPILFVLLFLVLD